MKPYKETILRISVFLFIFAALACGIPRAAAMLLVGEKLQPVTRDEMVSMVSERRNDIIEYINDGGYDRDDDIVGIFYVDRDKFYGHGAVRFHFDTVEYGADRFERMLCYVTDRGEERWLEYWLESNEYKGRGYERTVSGDRITWSHPFEHERHWRGSVIRYSGIHEITVEKISENFYYFASDSYYIR